MEKETNEYCTFNKTQTLRELLRSPNLVFLPDVKYVHISWSTLSKNLGHDFGLSGSDLCPEAACFIGKGDNISNN
jgi:hypothetical protein